jgi:hypothetical protein
MILYKYVDERGIDAVERSRLKVTPPDNFNDIFEMLPAYIGQYRRRDVKRIAKQNHNIRDSYNHMISKELFKGTFKQYKSYYKSNFSQMIDAAVLQTTSKLHNRSKMLPQLLGSHIGIICLSEKRDNLLMWSHYSNSHRGLVLGYDSNHLFFSDMKPPYKVDYVKERKVIDLSTPPDSQERESQIQSLLYVKSEDWIYEQEWRYVLRLDDANILEDKTTGGRYLKLPKDVLKEVILGYRVDDPTKEKVLSIIRNDYPGTTILYSDVHSTRYALQFNGEQGSGGYVAPRRVDEPHR